MMDYVKDLCFQVKRHVLSYRLNMNKDPTTITLHSIEAHQMDICDLWQVLSRFLSTGQHGKLLDVGNLTWTV